MAVINPAISVSNHDDLSQDCLPVTPTSIHRLSITSGRSRANSPTPSEVSRITLVEQHSELADAKASELSTQTFKLRWIDHLKGVFCIPNSHTNGYSNKKNGEEDNETESIESLEDVPCPWVIPVLVHSERKDSDKHRIHEQAQCTIDTGNLQGNIVSKGFLIETLGYDKANILPLSRREKNTKGISITGHRLIPEGAVHLTWYHRQSPRVFRNMRFLVSTHPVYDLIIGAESIRKNNILSVPNLGDAVEDNEEELPETMRNTRQRLKALVDKQSGLKSDLRNAKDDTVKKSIQKQLDEVGLEVAIARLENKIATGDAGRKFSGKVVAPKELKEWKKELKELKKKQDSARSISSTTATTGSQSQAGSSEQTESVTRQRRRR